MTDATKYPIDPAMTYRAAAVEWLQGHSRSIGPRTLRVYDQYVKAVTAFLGDLPLQEIDLAKIGEFQRWRAERASALRLNAEVCCALRPVLRSAGLWKHLEEFYKPLRVPQRKAGHSLSVEEERRLRAVALDSSRPRRLVAGHCMIIMLATTMGFGELRQLQRQDVDMEGRTVRVREGAKNIYRERTIPLNREAFESMQWILARWEKLGGSKADQYILPHHASHSTSRRMARGHKRTLPPDFAKPMLHIYKAARDIVNEAGLKGFRLYDCRVQAITKLLSNPKVSPQVSKEIAGHISQAMQDRYSIQQLSTKRSALEAIELDQSEVNANAEPMPEPPEQTPSFLVHPAVQAEIARQVALALGRDPEAIRPQPRLTMFPGGRAK